MPQPQDKKSKRTTDEEGSERLFQINAFEGIGIEVTDTSIWISHANTPQSDINLKQFIEELEHDGIAVEAKSFYCG